MISPATDAHTMNTSDLSLLLLGTLIATVAWQAHAAPLEISGGGLRAVWQDGELSLWESRGDRPFLTHAKIGRGTGRGEGRVDSVRDSVWGQGMAILVETASGDRCQVALFDGLPFAVLRSALRNEGTQERVVDKFPLLSTQLDLGAEPDTLRTMSTAGLRPLAGHPGGYAFLAVGHPASRRGVVCGWLTHEKGTGIVFSDVADGVAVLRARIDYGDLRVAAATEVTTETLLIGVFGDVRDGLERYGDAIAKTLDIHLPDQPTVYCTWYHGGASDEEHIARNTGFAREHLVPYGFHVMQIDDKWQSGVSNNGPRKNFSRARSDGPYPHGMKRTAEYIRARGLVPGIWFMPFAGTWNDPDWADKQELFYREGRSTDNYIASTNDGKRPDIKPGDAPYVVRWGGTCLDMTNPKTQDYLRSIVDRIANQWGYRYFKLDGLWTATGTRIQYVNSSYQDDDLGKARRHDPSLTPIEAYRKGLDIVRETAGKDVFLLGCCANQNMRSFGPAFGKVDAMRVGPDNGARPDRLVVGPLFSTRVYFLNKRVWYNDPDPVYVRPSFPTDMAQSSVSWTALTGSLHSSSYNYYELPEERLTILQRSLPPHELKTVRPVDYLEQDPARIWLLRDDRDNVRKDVIGLFNWDIEAPARIECPLARIGLPAAETYAGFEYWTNQFLPPLSGTVAADVPPGGCRIISIRPMADHPQVISTSRHVTQGVIDLRHERWDNTSGTLSGTSRVIGGEDYELRIVVPTGARTWRMRRAEVKKSAGDVVIRFVQDGPTIRMRFAAPQGGEIAWSATFDVQPTQP